VLPESIRVKLSTEAAGAISLTAVVARNTPVRELVEEILAVTGKDRERVRGVLQRGTLVSGATRFRWASVDAEAGEVDALLATFPDPDPTRIFAAERCLTAVLDGRRPIEISREAGMRKPVLRRSSFWDALMQAAAAGPLRYCEYSYRRRADRYRVEFSAGGRERLRAAARLVRYSALRRQIEEEALTGADLFVAR
jgi:hypothetical protein